jgi:hypothetical protein
MRVQFKVEGALPPKKDGANSMWKNDTEVPRLVALRSAAHACMAGRPPLVSNVRLGLRVHVAGESPPARLALQHILGGLPGGLRTLAQDRARSRCVA